MPRQPRIEFPGAAYHIIARGDRQEAIFLDDDDRARFLRSLGEACVRLGWEVRAWVLMGNHYHLALHTPEANLVEGMKWLQNSYTRYFNTRHDVWGHVFGGRYKSVLVDPEGDYQRHLIDYIHLNPARAGLVSSRRGKGLLSYAHSSLATGYAQPPSKRPAWLDTDTGFDLVELSDSTAGRRRYIERLEKRANEEQAERLGLAEIEGQTLHSTMQRGWYWGSQDFRERVAKLMPKAKTRANRNYASSPLGKGDAKQRAEAATLAVIEELGLECAEDGRPLFPRGDLRRGAAAWGVWRRSAASQSWIAERLGLRSPANVSQQSRRFAGLPDEELPSELRRWRRAELS